MTALRLYLEVLAGVAVFVFLASLFARGLYEVALVGWGLFG